MDEMTMLAELGRVPDADPQALADTRASLLAATRAGRPRLVRSGRLIAAAAAVVALGGGSLYAGLTLSTTNPTTTTTIECGPDTYIPTESGNPVADCYAALARSESQVPPLEGWITATGLAAVLPVGTAPPAGSHPLPAHFQVSAPIRFVTDALGDQAGPLATSCLTAQQATRYARSVLGVAGLGSWQVSVQGDGGTCPSYFAAVDAGSSAVDLQALGSSQGAGANNVGTRLDDELKEQLGATCAAAPDAVALAQRDAAALGIAADTMTVSNGGTVGAAPGCAAAFVEPAGFLDVVVWTAPVAPSAG